MPALLVGNTAWPESKAGIYNMNNALHSEALSFAVNVAQTQVDVGANALHGLNGQSAAQVLGVGPRRGQAEAKAAGQKDRRCCIKLFATQESDS